MLEVKRNSIMKTTDHNNNNKIKMAHKNDSANLNDSGNNDDNNNTTGMIEQRPGMENKAGVAIYEKLKVNSEREIQEKENVKQTEISDIENHVMNNKKKKSKKKGNNNMSSVNKEESDMETVMGFSGFGTTKNKKITSNIIGVVKVTKKKNSGFRQYMNREKGFNRSLSPPRNSGKR